MRVCTKCNVPKENGEFNCYPKRPGKPLKTRCKACDREYQKNLPSKEGISYDVYGTKVCTKCGEEKNTSEYFLRKEKGREGTLHAHCKACQRLYAIAGGHEGTPKAIAYNTQRNRLRLYGLKDGEYDRIWEYQNGLCAICHRPSTTLSRWGGYKSLSVDHCHSTGKVRGLLCDSCNRGVGFFKDNEELLFSAIEYLSQEDVRDKLPLTS